MKDSADLRARLEAAKRASIGHLLVRCGRLMNEAALRQVRADPRYAVARTAHLSLFPQLDHDATRLAELARRMEVSKQAAGQLVDDLEGLGLLERRPDPRDGRAKLIGFTDEGRAVMFRGLAAIAEVEAQALEVLSEKRREALRADLVRVMDALEPLGDG